MERAQKLFTVTVAEQYDAAVYAKHQHFLKHDALYSADLHFPLLVTLRPAHADAKAHGVAIGIELQAATGTSTSTGGSNGAAAKLEERKLGGHEPPLQPAQLRTGSAWTSGRCGLRILHLAFGFLRVPELLVAAASNKTWRASVPQLSAIWDAHKRSLHSDSSRALFLEEEAKSRGKSAVSPELDTSASADNNNLLACVSLRHRVDSVRKSGRGAFFSVYANSDRLLATQSVYDRLLVGPDFAVAAGAEIVATTTRARIAAWYDVEEGRELCDLALDRKDGLLAFTDFRHLAVVDVRDRSRRFARVRLSCARMVDIHDSVVAGKSLQ